MEEFRAGQNPIIIAPVHRDGRDFAYAIREEMKGEGMLGREDQEIARLEIIEHYHGERYEARSVRLRILASFG